MSAIQTEQFALPKDRAINTPVLRTLLICDLTESTAIVERLGDQRAAELMRLHARLSRDLLQRHQGREIDKTDGFLLLFERPIQAVAYALDYRRQLKTLGDAESIVLKARVGIHVGDVHLWNNEAGDIVRGAKPVEVEGLVKPVAARLMGIAQPGQILLSGTAYSLALRSSTELGDGYILRWRAHGTYRLKGVPEPMEVYEVGDHSVALFKSPTSSVKARREPAWWRRPSNLALEALAIAALISVPMYLSLQSPRAIAFAKRDWVVVGDFENITGKPVLDDSLQTAFRLGLEESRYVNVLSPVKVRDAVQRMQRNPQLTKIDRTIGSEIAIREGARALVLPTVTAIGTHVRVTAEVIDPTTQTTVYSESAEGEGADSLLASVDTVNRKLRLRLGEAMTNVSVDSQPLAKVATKDLDALRAYSLALQAYGESRHADARGLFQEAVKLDPEFALAYIGIARTYYSSEDLVTAKRYMDRAAAFKDHLAPRDQLYLDAWLAAFGPSDPLLAKWKLMSQLYPDYYVASYNYAYFAWLFENRASDAIAAITPALSEHNPQRGSAYYTLAYLQAAENEFDTALKNFDVAMALGNDPPGRYRAATYAAQRRFAEAEHVLSQAKPTGIATEDILFPRQAIVQQLDQGHWGPARSAISEALTTATQVGPVYDRTYRAMALTLDSYSQPTAKQARALRDFIAGAHQASEQPQAADHQDAMFAMLYAGYLAARSGQQKLAQTTLAATGPQTHNSGYTNLEHMQAIAEAEVEWRGGHANEAIVRLEPTVDGSELYLTHVALADAYTAAGRREDAFRQARWLEAHRGRAYLETNSMQILQAQNVAESDLALLRMAELAHALGRDEEAATRLAAFDALWPHAGQPPTVAARSEDLNRALHIFSRHIGS